MIKDIPPTLNTARFWRQVDVVDAWDCWEWLGRHHHSGYGKLKHRGKYYLPHRVAYVLLRGEPDVGLQLDHLCRNRICCNPNHLEPVTARVNVRRGMSGKHSNHRTRTFINGVPVCKNGHSVAGENAYVVRDRRRPGEERLGCLACLTMWNAIYRKESSRTESPS